MKIVDSDKPTKGKLYFVCETRDCSFWSWCHPVNQAVEMQGEMHNRRSKNSAQSVSCGLTSNARKMGDSNDDSGAAVTTKLEKLDEILQMLTRVIFVLSVLSIVTIIVDFFK